MNWKKIILVLLPAILIILAGCANHGLKQDAARIADAMCRNLELINKLSMVNPKDTLVSSSLEAEGKALQEEMEKLYKDFREKYGDKTKDPDFRRTYNDEVRKAMLKCRYLSKEDKLQFEKDLLK